MSQPRMFHGHNAPTPPLYEHSIMTKVSPCNEGRLHPLHDQDLHSVTPIYFSTDSVTLYMCPIYLGIT